MYKVVTHTIKEEHFTHPITVEHALLTKNTGHGSNVYPITSNISCEKSLSIMSLRDTFRLNIKDLMSRYVGTLRSAIVSIFNSGEDLPVLENEIAMAIDALKEGIRVINNQIYNGIPNSLFAQYLTDYTNILLAIAKAHKANASASSIETLEKNLIENIELFSDSLYSMNMHDWSKNTLYNYLLDFSDAIKSQITARKTKNWIEDQMQLKNAYNIFIDGIPGTLVPFTQYFADGIFMQFPWLIPLPINSKG